MIAKGHIRQIPIIKLIVSRSNIKDHVNDQMEGGFTALHLACARRDWSYAKLLIEGGASLEIRDNNEMTPLDVLNLSDIERLKIIDQGLSCDDKSTVKDYDSYVNGQKQIATFCKQTFYTDPNILKNKINQDYNINDLYIQKSVKLKKFHQQRSKSSASIKGKLEDFDLTNNKLKTIDANKIAISLKQVKKVETCRVNSNVNSNDQSNEGTSATNHADVLESTENGSEQDSQISNKNDEAISVTAGTPNIKSDSSNVDSQSSISVNKPEEDEEITISNSYPESFCSERLINKKEFEQQNKIYRNLTVISMVLCTAAVLALIATCYVKNMDKLPKIGLGLIAGMLFMVGTVSMVIWYQPLSDELDSTKIKAVACQTFVPIEKQKTILA